MTYFYLTLLSFNEYTLLYSIVYNITILLFVIAYTYVESNKYTHNLYRGEN